MCYPLCFCSHPDFALQVAGQGADPNAVKGVRRFGVFLFASDAYQTGFGAGPNAVIGFQQAQHSRVREAVFQPPAAPPEVVPTPHAVVGAVPAVAVGVLESAADSGVQARRALHGSQYSVIQHKQAVRFRADDQAASSVLQHAAHVQVRVTWGQSKSVDGIVFEVGQTAFRQTQPEAAIVGHIQAAHAGIGQAFCAAVAAKGAPIKAAESSVFGGDPKGTFGVLGHIVDTSCGQPLWL